MSLDIQIGSLGAENDHSKNVKSNLGKSTFFPHFSLDFYLSGNWILDPLSSGLFFTTAFTRVAVARDGFSEGGVQWVPAKMSRTPNPDFTQKNIA